MRFFWLFLFPLLLAAGGCKKSTSDKETVPEESFDKLTDITNRAQQYADSVFETLSLEEKIGQTFMPSINTSSTPYNLAYYQKLIDDYHVGGIVLAKGDVESAKKIAEIGRQAKVPLFISIDAEWGLGMRLADAQVFPMNGKIRKDAEESLLFDYGREVGRECRTYGINMVLGPVVDVVESRRGVIGSRSFGGDVKTVSNMGVAYAKGLESIGVISVAKHFPGQGSSITDSHRGTAPVYRNITALDSIDFLPFKMFIKSGLTGVMAGHIQLLAVNPDGLPATVSPDILTTLLRDEMGFKGLVITDAFSMGGAHGYSAYQALEAGADIVLCPLNMEKEIGKVIDKVNEGELDMTLIDDRCRRILFIKALFGLWNPENNEKEVEDYYLEREKLIRDLQFAEE